MRLIAFYLPQYHPTPENDRWWGKGFTEWTNVAKAKPLFRGHYQPHIPADLGFYDLRLPEVREQQAEMAREAGVEGFCYWHYWFGGGRTILERPFHEVLTSGKPNFPFCLGWANHSWTNKTWTKNKAMSRDTVLIEQTYSVDDYKLHFESLLPAFRDRRYMRIDGKPIFYIFDPKALPNAREFIDLWQQLARQNGLDGIYFVCRVHNISYWKIDNQGKRHFSISPDKEHPEQFYNEMLSQGFDAVNSTGLHRASMIVGSSSHITLSIALSKLFGIEILSKYDHKKIVEHMYVEADKADNVFPTIIPNWDRSPRAGRLGIINYNSTPEVFDLNVRLALDLLKNKPQNRQIVFLQSWNEWGEGNHVEPDLKYGHGYLDVLAKYFKQ